MVKKTKIVFDQVERKRAFAFGVVMLLIMLIATSVSGYLFFTLQKEEENRLARTIGTILSESINKISFSGKYHARLLLEEMQKRLPEFLTEVGNSLSTGMNIFEAVKSAEKAIMGNYILKSNK